MRRLQSGTNRDIRVGNQVGGRLAPLCTRTCAQRAAQRRLIGRRRPHQFLNLGDRSPGHLHCQIGFRLAREIAHLKCAGNSPPEHLSVNPGNARIPIGKRIVSIESDDVRKGLLVGNCQS